MSETGNNQSSNDQPARDIEGETRWCNNECVPQSLGKKETMVI